SAPAALRRTWRRRSGPPRRSAKRAPCRVFPPSKRHSPCRSSGPERSFLRSSRHPLALSNPASSRRSRTRLPRQEPGRRKPPEKRYPSRLAPLVLIEGDGLCIISTRWAFVSDDLGASLTWRPPVAIQFFFLF